MFFSFSCAVCFDQRRVLYHRHMPVSTYFMIFFYVFSLQSFISLFHYVTSTLVNQKDHNIWTILMSVYYMLWSEFLLYKSYIRSRKYRLVSNTDV